MHEYTSPEVTSFLEKKEAVRDKREIPLESVSETSAILRTTAEKVAEISKTWNPIEFYTADPEGLKQEKEHFLAAFAQDEKYTPEFSYPAVENLDVHQSKAQLQELYRLVKEQEYEKNDRRDRISRVALLAKIKDVIATCDLVVGIQTKDEKHIKHALERKYMGTDPKLLETAHHLYAQLTQLETPTELVHTPGLYSHDEQAFLKKTMFNADEIKEAFVWALEKLGIHNKGEEGFRVVIDPRATSIDVRDKTAEGPTVFIPTTRNMDGQRLLGLINHEIGSHARQSMNGVKLFQIGGGALKVDEETFYEGLAMREEEAFVTKYFGNKDNPALPFFGRKENYSLPFYALAVEKAEEGKSFHDIFSYIHKAQLHVALKISPHEALPPKEELPEDVDKVAQQEAWRITCRVMRGHTDMSNPEQYGLTKDLAYLRGYYLDKQLVEAGYGYINEAAVIAGGGGLRALAEYNIQPEDLPIPYRDLGNEYWEEVLKPRMLAEELKKGD